MEKEFSIFEYYSITHRPEVIICYRGPITDLILREISKDIRSKFADDVQTSRRVFAIYMELAQNILYYSSEKNYIANRAESVGALLLTQKDEHYTFSFGNLVENQYLKELVKSCQIINDMAGDREKLREYKREQRKAPKKERSKGAGIGLIQVALTSRNPLKVEYREVDQNHSLFALSVKIDKIIE